MGAHGSMQAVAADIRPCLDWRHPTSISEKREGGGPHDAGRRFALQSFTFRNLASTQASSPKAGNPKALSLKGG